MTLERKDGSQLNSMQVRTSRAAMLLNKRRIVQVYNCINYIILYIYTYISFILLKVKYFLRYVLCTFRYLDTRVLDSGIFAHVCE